MENIHTTDSYIAVLEHRLAALTAERDRFRAEAICLSEELQGLRVLVVDDEAAVRLTLDMLLRRVGYSVTTATNGEEALEAVS